MSTPAFGSARTGHASFRTAHPLLAGSLLCVVAAACSDGDNPMELEEPVDPCTVVTDIGLGQSTSGTLTTTDCVQPSGVYGDRWRLTLATAADVRIDLKSLAFDPYLELRTASGSIIDTNDDAGSLDSRIVRPLDAGSYIIIARSFGPGETGSYDLSVMLGPDCSAVGELALGVPETGALEPSDCLFEFGGFMDNWALNLTSTQKLRIELESADFAEIVLVRDPQGQIIDGADAFGPDDAARLDTELPAGDWTISATSYDETQLGSYELTVDLAPPCTPGAELEFGTSVSGELSSSDCLLDGFITADSFAVTLAQETAIGLQLKSADFRPLMVLRDHNGSDVGVGFDDDGDGIARINMSVAGGSYALYVAGADGPQSRGAYSLTTSEITCPTPAPVAFGQTVDGTLDESDCLRASGAFQEVWELVLSDDASTRIDLVSSDFDTFLELRDDQGALIESNDDGGSDLNSRIERTLSAGTYRIVASSFGSGETGDYQLTVGAPPQSASVASAVGDGGGPSSKASANQRTGTGALVRWRDGQAARIWWREPARETKSAAPAR